MEVENAVNCALQCGYRHLDCAAVYQVGRNILRACFPSRIDHEWRHRLETLRILGIVMLYSANNSFRPGNLHIRQANSSDVAE